MNATDRVFDVELSALSTGHVVWTVGIEPFTFGAVARDHFVGGLQS